MTPDFTVCLALDFQHLTELALVAPTWARNRPQVFKAPWLVFCDDAESEGWWRRRIAMLTGHSDAETTVVLWPKFSGVGQRHRMLSSFTWGVAEFCDTPWVFKIDTDCCCVPCDDPWPPPEWFSDESGYVFIARKWTYTKPTQMYLDVCRWARTIPVFDGKPEVPGEWTDPLGTCSHPRIISFACFERLSFIREVASMSEPPGPIPSHDTLHWYVAHRLGYPYMRLKGGYGFSHGAKKLAARCEKAMEEGG